MAVKYNVVIFCACCILFIIKKIYFAEMFLFILGGGIKTYNPFDKNYKSTDRIVDSWGKMIYRDRLHAHGSRHCGRLRRYT